MNSLKLSRKIQFIIPALLIFLFNQCMHDEFDFDKLDTDIELNASILTPLAYGSLSLNDLISELDSSGYINTYPDGLLYLAYEDSLFSYVAEDLMDVPDQDFIEFFIKSDFTFPPGWPDITLERSEKFAFSFSNNEQLDSIRLDDGDLVFNISSSFRCTGQIIMEFPNIHQNGTPVSMIINLDDPSGTFSKDTSLSLYEHTIVLDDSTGTDEQFLPVNFTVELINEGFAVTDDDSINIVATINNIDFDAIFGYIGDYELITETGEVEIGFFENPLDGSIRFANPEINFKLRNSYGVPAAVEIDKFTGYGSEGDSIEMTFDAGVNPFRYAYPTLADYNNSTFYKDTVLSINGQNSNVSDFLEFMPVNMQYSLKAVSNPDGEGADYNFVTDESQIDVGFEFVLPLWFTSDFVFVDTIEGLELDGANDAGDLIEKITVLLEVSNGLPMDIDFQLIFVDSLYNSVDSLFADNSQPIIEAGITELDNTYTPPSLRVISPNTKVSVVSFTGDEIKNLERVRHGIIRAGIKTPNVGGVQEPALFYSDYSISFNISAGINVSGEIEID